MFEITSITQNLQSYLGITGYFCITVLLHYRYQHYFLKVYQSTGNVVLFLPNLVGYFVLVLVLLFSEWKQ